MIYLDYSATTPTSKEVLDSFNKASLDYIGNPNSLHTLGVKANELINKATEQIAKLLNVKPSEIIYTSGASESNNMAIKGICEKYSNRGKHIITTHYEHSSIYGPLGYLQDKGYEVDFTKVKESGLNKEIITIPNEKIVIGLANAWADKQFLFINKNDLIEAFDYLKINNITCKGMMFWDLKDEGMIHINDDTKTPFYMAEVINSIYPN